MSSQSESHANASLSCVSADGSPVAVYRALPTMGEAELIHAASGAHATILELGCGAGRVTHALIDEAQLLSDEAFRRVVHAANFGVERWLDDKRTWAVLKTLRDLSWPSHGRFAKICALL